MTEEAVTLATPDGPMDAFVARPDGAGPFPAVIVAQEAFGVNEHIRDVCRRFAGEGYVAVAPELFHRAGRGIVVPYGDFEATRPYLAGLTNDGLEQDLAAALAHLRGRDEVAPRRVGLVGFCVGGFVAFLAACRLDVAAVASFYGGGIVHPRAGGKLQPLLEETGNIRAPLVCFFGEEDRGIPPADIEAIRSRLDRLEVPHEIVVYPGAGHAFFCDQRPSYRPEAAADAWRRTLGWLGRHMGAAAMA